MNSFPRMNPGDPLFHLPASARSLIDVGCNVGELIRAASIMGVERMIGVDINPHAIDMARERCKDMTRAEFHACSADALPAESNSMDVAYCCEVLEHVPQELRAGVIAEIARVLKPGGKLILTTPAAGAFGWMDPANMRFRVPALFRWISRPFGGGGRDKGYEGQKHGVVWHHHFKTDELRALFQPHLQIELVRYRGALIVPIMSWMLWPFYRTGTYGSFLGRTLLAIEKWDYNRNWGRWLAYNVLMVATKPPALHHP